MSSDNPSDVLPILTNAHRGFDAAMRGYDRAQVDQFLTHIDEDVRAAVAERNSMAARSADLAAQLASAQAQIESLRRQLRKASETVTAETVDARVRTRLEAGAPLGARLVIADAETGLDLRALAEAARQLGDQVLPVGSAGLAEWLMGALTRPAHAPRAVSLSGGPILVVSGTTNRVGLVQLARLIDRGAGLVVIAAEAALDDPDAAGAAVADDVVQHLRNGACVALGLQHPRRPELDFVELAAVRGLEPGAATDRLVRALARAAERAVAAVTPAALVLTGGDTARAVCNALGTQALEVHREAAPGVPISLLQGGQWDGLPVVTKAGGFGTMDTLARLVRELEVLRA
jgi:DivIVA domain-containing protein